MRALYGYSIKNGVCKYELIYDKHHNVGDPIVMKHHTVINERDVTKNECDIIVCKMKKSYRIYEYDTIDNLVNDELNMLIITPFEVVENFKTNEKSHIG